MFNAVTSVYAVFLTAGVVHGLVPQIPIAEPYSTHDESHETSHPTGNIQYVLPTERVFLLNVPETYNHSEAHPLVLSFHGATEHSLTQQAISELSDPSLRIAGKPFLTAYGQGVNNTDSDMIHVWQGAPYANKTADDIAYVQHMMAAIAATHTIDPARIYATGKSNGGGFAALLACDAATAPLLAAVAPVAPALYPDTRAMHNCAAPAAAAARPVPMLHVHGTADAVASFYGRGPGGESALPDVRVWRRLAAERNGCGCGLNPGAVALPDSVVEVHDGVWEEVWSCEEQGGAEVRALSVVGLGHAWPSTGGLEGPGDPSYVANFNFTSQHLVQFFSRHSLESKVDEVGEVDEVGVGA